MDVFLSSGLFLTAMAGSSTAMAAIAASAAAKLALYNNDSALAAVAASGTAMAALRAAAGYSVVSWAESGTTPVSIPLAGTAYILLGASRNGTTVAYTSASVRADSPILGVLPGTSGASSTTALDFNVAIPLKATYTGKATSGAFSTAYFGLLRCDF